MDGTEAPKVLPKIQRDQAEACDLALTTISRFLEGQGFGAGEIGVAFKVGLCSMALQAAKLDSKDKSLSGELNDAIDRAINETIAMLRTRTGAAT